MPRRVTPGVPTEIRIHDDSNHATIVEVFTRDRVGVLYAITQTLAGPAAAARWVGVQNGLANIAGIVAPLITGFVVDRTGSFIGAFVTAAVVAFVGAAGWGLIIRRVEPVDWANA